MRAARSWGATAGERAAAYPCDALVAGRRWRVHRAIDVGAPAEWTWRWVCQLRAAPYSYDLIDNLGRRSPRALTPGLGSPAPGDSVMHVFAVAAVSPGSELTITLRRPRRGLARRLIVAAALTYRVIAVAPGRSRIVVRYVSADPPGAMGAVLRAVMPVGDLLMMRRQLLTLRDLAQRDAARAGGAAPPP